MLFKKPKTWTFNTKQMLVRNIMLKKKENPIELEMIQRRLIERERELAQEAT